MNAAVPDELSLELWTGGEGGAAPETGLHACIVARTPAWTLPPTGGPKRAPRLDSAARECIPLQDTLGSCAVAHAQTLLLSHRIAPAEPPYPHRMCCSAEGIGV